MCTPYTHSFFQAIKLRVAIRPVNMASKWCGIAIMHELVSLRVEGLKATKVELFKHKEFSSLEVGIIDD